MTYDCMTADELAAWQEAAEQLRRTQSWGATTPCADCPMSFRLQEIAVGRCIRVPIFTNPAAPKAIARREYNREWMRRYRAAVTV